MSLDLVDLIEEEKRAEKTLEEARERAKKISGDARKMAGEMVEKATKETFFQDFIDKRTGEINEKKTVILKDMLNST